MPETYEEVRGPFKACCTRSHEIGRRIVLNPFDLKYASSLAVWLAVGIS
jgi:hypothetical protein